MKSFSNPALGRPSWSRFTGLLAVLAMHGAAVYALWHYEIRLSPQETVTVFVDFINPPPPAPRRESPKPKAPAVKPPEPVRLVPPPPPEPQPLAVEAPVVAPEEAVATPLPPSEIEAAPGPSEPVQLTTDLSVACPKRFPPDYPPSAKRLAEQGRVVVRVELDEQGRIGSARIENSSGSPRLDGAALAAVKNWRCTPAVRDGVPIRAVALQPFLFKLEGR
ncbi:MAG TPA: energy transducer TonB [Nitrospiria bacterium]|nr:energy transducer TonB [Nitrospiria bacterium]